MNPKIILPKVRVDSHGTWQLIGLLYVVRQKRENYFDWSKCSLNPSKYIQIVRMWNIFTQMNDNWKVIRSETQLAECLRESRKWIWRDLSLGLWLTQVDFGQKTVPQLNQANQIRRGTNQQNARKTLNCVNNTTGASWNKSELKKLCEMLESWWTLWIQWNW